MVDTRAVVVVDTKEVEVATVVNKVARVVTEVATVDNRAVVSDTGITLLIWLTLLLKTVANPEVTPVVDRVVTEVVNRVVSRLFDAVWF